MKSIKLFKTFVILSILIISLMPVSINRTVLAMYDSISLPSPYYVPFGPEAGQIRVARTGYLYKSDYNNSGLTGFDDGDYHPAWVNNQGQVTYRKEDRAAIDFSGNFTVRAAADGIVTASDLCQVKIKTGDDEVIYLHHSHIIQTFSKTNKPLAVGDKVSRGDVIAVTGAYKDCGADGSHLHFAVWRGGREIPVYFQDAPTQTSNGKTCPAGLICPSHKNYVEFRYTGSPLIPSTPSNIQISYSQQLIQGQTFVFANLSWVDTSSNETQFYIMDVTHNTAYNTPANVTSWQYPFQITPNSSTCFTIQAANSSGFSQATNQVCTQMNPQLIVSQPLSLSATSPAVNQSITATFKVKNIGGMAMTLQTLSAGSRRGSDWNGVNTDFPSAANITLEPGAEYTYQQSRSFDMAGAYFAEPVVLVNDQWGGIPDSNGGFSRVSFNVNVVTTLPSTGALPIVFDGGVSKLWQDGNYNRANLTITAKNLNGQRICVHFWRPGRDFGITCQVATSNSITFWDLDLKGPMNRKTTYYSQAAMNQDPISSWPAPNCAGPTGGQGLCDKIYRP